MPILRQGLFGCPHCDKPFTLPASRFCESFCSLFKLFEFILGNTYFKFSLHHFTNKNISDCIKELTLETKKAKTKSSFQCKAIQKSNDSRGTD